MMPLCSRCRSEGGAEKSVRVMDPGDRCDRCQWRRPPWSRRPATMRPTVEVTGFRLFLILLALITNLSLGIAVGVTL